MIVRNIEHSGHLALFNTLPHQSLVAASTQSQGEGIKQNRLAGTCFAGENGEAVGKLDVESVDQNYVTNRKSGEHAAEPGPSDSPSLKTQMASTRPAMTL